MAAPKTANILISVGGQDIMVSHANFSEIEITRTAKDVCDSFTLSILDDDAYRLEYIILAGYNFIEVSYIGDNLNTFKWNDKEKTEAMVFSGYIYTMDMSFIDNRHLLKLSGFLSTSLKDKFEKYSFKWNVVPKFDWSEVLGAADQYAYYKVADGSNSQSLDYAIKDDWSFYKRFFYRLGSWNWDEISTYKEVLDNIFDADKISMDKQGNYYMQKYLNDNDNTVDEEKSVMTGNISILDEYDTICKSNGNYTIPIKPHKLLKLICCGGKYSDLLEKEYSDYKGTAFYKSKLSVAEWYYIKKWYERLGSFKGLGYKSFECNYDTKVTQDEFIQTKQSFLEFMYNSVLPKCVYEKNDKMYTNFYLSFKGNTVKMSRIDASAKPTPVARYIYYGKFEDDGKNKGRLTSFTPTLDILTAMITKGTYSPGEEADLSRVNLAGGKGTSDIVVSASGDSKSDENLRYKVKWGVTKIATSTKTSDKFLGEKDIIKTFETASNLAYRATATIEGMNTIFPQDFIEIIINPGVGDSLHQLYGGGQAPSYHHLSGSYFVLKKVDTISNGRFTSKLDLIKNINKIGDTAQYMTEEEEVDVGDLKYKVTSISSGEEILDHVLK